MTAETWGIASGLFWTAAGSAVAIAAALASILGSNRKGRSHHE